MKRSVILTVLWMACIGACGRSNNTPVAKLTHEIYIWQRVWNPGVKDAAIAAKNDCDGLSPLAAWLDWSGNAGNDVPKVRWADVPWKAFSGKCVAAAIRVEPRASLPASNATLTATAVEAVGRALREGVALDEIQLDFDAAESQLSIYAKWLADIRAAVAPVRVTFTALPCWLNQPAFQKLAHSADGYVLQVHAAEKPTPESTLLCDPVKAQRWIQQAARVAPGFRR